GEAIDDHRKRCGFPFGRPRVTATVNRESPTAALLPFLRGQLSTARRVIAHYDSSDDALAFAGSAWAAELCAMGTSCPDHFLRTRICPMFVPWNPADEPIDRLRQQITERLATYRHDSVASFQ